MLQSMTDYLILEDTLELFAQGNYTEEEIDEAIKTVYADNQEVLEEGAFKNILTAAGRGAYRGAKAGFGAGVMTGALKGAAEGLEGYKRVSTLTKGTSAEFKTPYGKAAYAALGVGAGAAKSAAQYGAAFGAVGGVVGGLAGGISQAAHEIKAHIDAKRAEKVRAHMTIHNEPKEDAIRSLRTQIEALRHAGKHKEADRMTKRLEQEMSNPVLNGVA